jgi:mannose-6-phosphate isomerase-like protein (cupin superfamily)
VRVERADPAVVKGWYLGPWNSDLPISLGYAPTGIDEPHIHTRITEIYLVARGTSELRVGDRTVALAAGDVVVVEPGEPHTLAYMSTLQT